MLASLRGLLGGCVESTQSQHQGHPCPSHRTHHLLPTPTSPDPGPHSPPLLSSVPSQPWEHQLISSSLGEFAFACGVQGLAIDLNLRERSHGLRLRKHFPVCDTQVTLGTPQTFEK